MADIDRTMAMVSGVKPLLQEVAAELVFDHFTVKHPLGVIVTGRVGAIIQAGFVVFAAGRTIRRLWVRHVCRFCEPPLRWILLDPSDPPAQVGELSREVLIHALLTFEGRARTWG
jgi:hypothetical protein